MRSSDSLQQSVARLDQIVAEIHDFCGCRACRNFEEIEQDEYLRRFPPPRPAANSEPVEMLAAEERSALVFAFLAAYVIVILGAMALLLFHGHS